ncbi:type III secretion system inner rod subunit SctI [Pseudomonas zeae]|uniref:type III secretion system inner rod subunit SctI n=1 Tax=Pseudomonas zeae TaxID=2745510 RepID=UPI0039DF946B
MQIDAISLNAPMTVPATTPAAVPPADIEAFSQALFGRTQESPENSALNRLQSTSQTVENALIDAKQATLDNPLKMLSVQSQMLHSVFEVDLIAKTAGGLTQGINKLVSMQ